MAARSMGIAGGGLDDAAWAVNRNAAKVGQRYEQEMGRRLDRLTDTCAGTVLHDLRIPIPNISANIDHVWVTGRHVWPLDTKGWLPGFMWTAFGMSFRGLERVRWAEKRTQVMASESLPRHLAGTGAIVHTPLLAVFCTRPEMGVQTWALKVPGAKVSTPDAVLDTLRRHDCGPADKQVVQRLALLLNNRRAATKAEAALPRFVPVVDQF